MVEALRISAEHCDLPVVLQLVAGQLLTGRLVVESDLAIEATIACVGGRPVDATVGERHGLEAFYEAFLVPQHQFRFLVQEQPDAAPPPLGEVMGLLLEACRRLDEWRTISELLLRAEGEAPSEHRPVWERLDGTRRLAPVVEELQLSRTSIVASVRGWLSAGQVVQLDAPPSSPPSPPEEGSGSDVVAALVRGRAQVRSGDARAAVGSFRDALAIDPHHLIARQHLRRLRELHPDLFHPPEAS